MTTTQPLDLAPIQARLDATTPGPWSADGHEIYQGTPDDYTINSLWIGETCNIDLPDHGRRERGVPGPRPPGRARPTR